MGAASGHRGETLSDKLLNVVNRWLGFVALSGLLAGCGPAAFGCSDDDQCQSEDGAAGTCELTGFCSFPDPACPSGRRYGDLAGGGYAGQCAVDPFDADTDTEAGSASGTGSTSSTDPTVSPTTEDSTTDATTTPGPTTDGPDDTSGGEAEATTDPGPSCSDTMLNGDETDVDCGGSCPGCSLGEMCDVDTDCFSRVCADGVCVERKVPSGCDDGMQNGDETGVDCGGACIACGVVCNGEPARWNPDDAQMNIEFLDDGRTATITVDSVNDSVRADTSIDGRHYWEVRVAEGASGWVRIGAADSTLNLEVGPSGTNGFGLATNGSIPGVGASGLSVGVGDTVGVAVDVEQQRAWVHVNGTWGFDGGPTMSEGQQFDFNDPAPFFPVLTLGQGDTLQANFGNSAFEYTIPPGFVGGVCG